MKCLSLVLLLVVCFSGSVVSQIGDVRTVFTFGGTADTVYYDAALGNIYAVDSGFNGLLYGSIGATSDSNQEACNMVELLQDIVDEDGGFFPLWGLVSIDISDEGIVYAVMSATHNLNGIYYAPVMFDPINGSCVLTLEPQVVGDFETEIALNNAEGLLYTLIRLNGPTIISVVLDIESGVSDSYDVSGASLDYSDIISNIVVLKDSNVAFFSVYSTNAELWMINATGAHLIMELDAGHNTDTGLYLALDETRLMVSVFSEAGVSFINYDSLDETYFAQAGIVIIGTSKFLPMSGVFYFVDVGNGVTFYNTSVFPPVFLLSLDGVIFGEAFDETNLFFTLGDRNVGILDLVTLNHTVLIDSAFEYTQLTAIVEREQIVVQYNNGSDDILAFYDINGPEMEYVIPFETQYIFVDGGRGILGGWSESELDILALSFSDCVTFGFYDDYCLLQCPCNLDQGTCSDGVAGDGTCQCDDGWSLDSACYDCDESHYGDSCSMCTCVSGVCDSGIFGLGTCISCDGNFDGDNCDVCYGNYNGSNCDSCLVGWSGDDCDICEADHYGENCTPCDCTTSSTCDDTLSGSGECTCLTGWTGDDCDICEADHYGENCTPCDCPTNSSCDDELSGSGDCTCDSGWSGDSCDESESEPEDSTDQKIPNHSMTLLVSFTISAMALF